MTMTTPMPRTLRKLSFVLPIFNEAESIDELRSRLAAVTKKLNCEHEIVLVNDGSFDDSYQKLTAWASDDVHAKIIHFSRNFGHQSAITAGIDYSTGDAVVVMDADLQDPPELVLDMVDRYAAGFDIVYAQRTDDMGLGVFKKYSSRLFYRFMKKFVYADLPENVGDFRLMSRKAVLAFCAMREGQRFVRGMVAWVGFSQTTVKFKRPPRLHGETKYHVRAMVRFALDGILSFSSAPLRLGLYVGTAALGLGFVMALYSILRELIFHDLVPGWASLIVLSCVFSGSILICLGFLGEYVGRIYDEIKSRPIYIIKETRNVPSKPSFSRGIDVHT